MCVQNQGNGKATFIHSTPSGTSVCLLYFRSFREKWQRQYGGFPYPLLTQLLPSLTSDTNPAPFARFTSRYRYIMATEARRVLRSPQLLPAVLLLFQDPIQGPTLPFLIASPCHVTWPGQFFRLSPFVTTVTVLRTPRQKFCRTSLTWELLGG